MHTYDNITAAGLHIHLSMSNHNTCYIFVNDIFSSRLVLRFFNNTDAALEFINRF
jgi:hypothetical protein